MRKQNGEKASISLAALASRKHSMRLAQGREL
jgi:hypothetical protein